MKNYRDDFPIFQKHPELIYLDSAATSQKPSVVLDAMREYYENYNANVKRGIYPIAEKATIAVESVRKNIAAFLNARHAEEIIFVRNATEAINLVAYAWGNKYIKKDDIVVTSIVEHHANFVPWQQLCKRNDAVFTVLDINENYELLLLEEKIKNAKLFAISYVSNMLGTINPIKDIIKKVRTINNDITILVDAAQAAPHMAVDVQNLDCDFLVFSGHKTLASTGSGILYGKKEILQSMPPFLFGGEMIQEVSVTNTTFADIPHRFEAGTPDIAGIISLGAALEYLSSIGMDTVRLHEKELVTYALTQLKNTDGVKIYGPENPEKRGGVIAFTLEGIHPHDIAHILGNENICIRAGHHCAMQLHTRLGIQASGRISFHVYNNENDIDMFLSGIKKVQKMFS